MDLPLLETRLAEGGEPAYRARQVWDWAARGVPSYAEMTNLPLSLRHTLADEVPFSTLTVETEHGTLTGRTATIPFVDPTKERPARPLVRAGV